MNTLVRVVCRKKINSGELVTTAVLNHVVEGDNTKNARKIVRKAYHGQKALIGLIRKTNLNPGVYIPEEKPLKV